MRLLLATHRYPVPDRPDLLSDVAALREFVRQWVIAGHEVTVAHLYEHENFDRRRKPPPYGLRITETELDGARVLRAECRYVRRLPALARPYLRRVAGRLNKRLGEIDLALIHFPTALGKFGANIARGAPRVATLHVTDADRLEKAKGGDPMRLLGRHLAIGYRSEAIRRRVHAIVRPDSPEFIAHSGAPPVAWNPPARERGGALRVLYAGRLIERKRVDAVLRALSETRGFEWRFAVIGKGPMRARIEALARTLGVADRVTFAGALPREGVLERMTEHDVFCMVSEGETLGIAYLEAMSRGLIAVGSRGEGIDGIIEDGANGFLVDPGDAEGLRALLARIAAMPDAERDRLREAALATARRMGEAEMAEAYLRNALECAGIGCEP